MWDRLNTDISVAAQFSTLAARNGTCIMCKATSYRNVHVHLKGMTGDIIYNQNNTGYIQYIMIHTPYNTTGQ
jgi:hypothetical protein